MKNGDSKKNQSKEKGLAIYSIRDLEQISGIKAHTIRAWEQRYKILTPQRTKTNIRYYTDIDLKHLLNISLLNKNGIKISKIAKMTKNEVAAQVSAISEVSMGDQNNQLDALTISMIQMDEVVFSRIINADIKQLGFERTMIEVINPFLEKLSLLWLTSSLTPIHEQFITCLIRQKIIAAIDQLDFPRAEYRKKFLIFLPEGDNQELSLLFLYYLLKSRKHAVVYLGGDVACEDLVPAIEIHKPDYIFTKLSPTYTKQSCQGFVDQLCSQIHTATLLLSGYMVIKNPINLPTNAKVLSDLTETISFLNSIKINA